MKTYKLQIYFKGGSKFQEETMKNILEATSQAFQVFYSKSHKKNCVVYDIFESKDYRFKK